MSAVLYFSFYENLCSAAEYRHVVSTFFILHQVTLYKRIFLDSSTSDHHSWFFSLVAVSFFFLGILSQRSWSHSALSMSSMRPSIFSTLEESRRLRSRNEMTPARKNA